ncbi:MAG: DUF4857 domain-containing protein [Deltaproteobacteria bacterium]|nr:MAG: DUF4857 domain-containing protein [Deltaproteobacteria bacterium]
MSIRLARLALMLLAVMVMGVFLPIGQKMLSGESMGKTQLFYSPVIKKFIYREKVGEGHSFVTLDEDGTSYDRTTFETMIPFIYYRNMELWGKLPLVLDGQTFTKEQIRTNRQVFELKARNITGNFPRIQVFPLLESVPGRSRLRFPEDAFRMTDQMEFINVDTNKVDPVLTQIYTKALTDAGFVFPARLVAGKVSILKPFDEGFFLVDARNTVFHIKRVKGKPFVVRTPIPADLGIRHIKVSENKKKAIYGLILTHTGELYLMTYDNYGLIRLPVEGYKPDTMDIKLIINPLFVTAIFSDDTIIHAVAMNKAYEPIARYQHVMFSGKKRVADKIVDALFPFVIQTHDANTGYLPFRFQWSGWTSLLGTALALAVGCVLAYRRKGGFRTHWPDLVLIVVTGFYGLLAVTMIGPETD